MCLGDPTTLMQPATLAPMGEGNENIAIGYLGPHDVWRMTQATHASWKRNMLFFWNGAFLHLKGKGKMESNLHLFH